MHIPLGTQYVAASCLHGATRGAFLVVLKAGDGGAREVVNGAAGCVGARPGEVRKDGTEENIEG